MKLIDTPIRLIITNDIRHVIASRVTDGKPEEEEHPCWLIMHNGLWNKISQEIWLEVRNKFNIIL